MSDARQYSAVVRPHFWARAVQPGITNFAASRCIKGKKASLPIDERHSGVAD